jgi:hypothetical protein
MLVYTGGHLSAPLDDTIIYFQYGKQIARGKLFQYNDEDGYSSGCTSFIYPFVIALGWGTGFRGDLLFIYTFLVSTLFLYGSSLIFYLIIIELSDIKTAWIGTLLFLLNGSLLWVYFAGMETGMFIMLILLTLFLFLKEKSASQLKYTAISAACLALTRPEGFGLACILSFLLFVEIIYNWFCKKKVHWKYLLNSLYPPLVGTIPFLMNKLFIGYFSSNTMMAKSYTYSHTFYWLDILSESISFLLEITKGMFIGTYTDEWLKYFPPLFGLFALIGFGKRITSSFMERKFDIHIVSPLWMFGGLYATCLSFIQGWKGTFRYQIPFFSIFIIYAALGISDVVSFLANKTKTSNNLFYGLSVFMIVCTFLTVPIWVELYGWNCSNIYHQQITMGKWMKENLPPDVCIGINDAGALKYYGEQYIVDFIGLVTNHMVIPWRNGIGTVFENLENFYPGRLPDFYVIYPDWFQEFHLSGILREKIFEVRLRKNTVCGAEEKVVYRADYSLLNSGKYFRIDHGEFDIVDEVDVADLKSEKEHRYEIKTNEYGLTPGNLLERKLYGSGDNAITLVDGGRFTNGYEEMYVKVNQGKPVKIVMRTLVSKEVTLETSINDKRLGVWRIPPSENWQEPELSVPTEFIDSNTFKLKIRALNDCDYTSFHYWFLQPK